MLEETIKELCRLVKIPKETAMLCDSKNDAHFKNKEFLLHHYKTTELEAINLICINEDDIEIDITAYPDDNSYLMEIRIKTYYLLKARNLAEGIKSKCKTFQKAKKYLMERAFPCENPYEMQVLIPIENDEQKDAAGFAHSLLSAYISNLNKQKQKDEAARKKCGRRYSSITDQED